MMFFSKVASISTDELQALMAKEKVAVLDVREVDEFQSGHIKGAKNVPLSRIEGLTLTSKTYVICHSGIRSKQAVNYLKKKGYNVINVSGGMSRWHGKVV